MALFEAKIPVDAHESSNAQLLQNLKDYTAMAFALVWQRQAIFIATSLLTAFYFDPVNAFVFYCTILICELQDVMIARRVGRLKMHQVAAIHSSLIWILLNTILSSAAICLYAISIALKQETGDILPRFSSCLLRRCLQR